MDTAAQVVLLAAAGVFLTLRAGGGPAIGGLPQDIPLPNDADRPALCAAQPAEPDSYLQTLTRVLLAAEALALPDCDR